MSQNTGFKPLIKIAAKQADIVHAGNITSSFFLNPWLLKL